MSAALKRLSMHTTDLAELAKRVRPEHKQKFDLFYAKSTKYIKDVNANLPEAPAIDWSYYRRSVKPEMQAMVDQFQKSYETYEVPAPQDNLSAKIEEESVVVMGEIDQFKCKSADRIVKYNADIDALKALLPFDQMTMEDFIDAYPSAGPDFLNRPTFWPHRDEDQPDPNASNLLPGETHLLQQIMIARERLTTNNVTSNEQPKSERDLAWKPY